MSAFIGGQPGVQSRLGIGAQAGSRIRWVEQEPGVEQTPSRLLLVLSFPQDFVADVAVGTWVGSTLTFQPGGVNFTVATAGAGWFANTITFENAFRFQPATAVATWVASTISFTPGQSSFAPTTAMAKWVATTPTFVAGARTFAPATAPASWVANQITWDGGSPAIAVALRFFYEPAGA